MNDLRINRINNFKEFYDNSKTTFKEFSDKDINSHKFRDAYSLCICPGSRNGGTNKRVVEIFFGSRPFESITNGRDWTTLTEYGATLLYDRDDSGYIIVSLYPANTDKQKQIESLIFLEIKIDPKKLKDKNYLKKHWNDLVAYMECTSLDGNPTISQKIRIAYLRTFKHLIIDSKWMPTRVSNYSKDVLKFVLTVGLSGFIIYLVTIFSTRQKENKIEQQHIQTIDKTQKAFVTPSNIDSVIFFEKKFSKNDSTPAPNKISWFEYRSGTKKILIIAGHATAQMRDGKIKQSDAGTGSIAIELNKLLNVPVLFTTYLSPSDPNYYDNNEFKDTLSKIADKIKPIIVIDLHGSHPYRPYDIDFGTMNGKSYLTRLDLFNNVKLAFRNEGFTNQSQDFFSAEKNQTVTKYLYNKGIPCIQLEINSNYLSADQSNIYGQKTAQLLQALICFIDETTK